MMYRSGGPQKPPASLLIAAFLIVILGIVVIVSSFTVLQIPDHMTEQGRRTNTLYQATLVISMIIYFGVTAGIIWACFRYRRTNNVMPEQIHGSSTLEMVWTVIPVVILVALFIPSLLMVIDLKTPPKTDDIDLTVEAIGHQWWWEFSYPDARVSIQRTPPDYNNLTPPKLVVPVGQTVRIYVKSTDVIHSFYAPRMLYKLQAIPGNVNQFHFKAEKVGTYTGQCYQFCGLRHADMLFSIEVMEERDYQNWLQQQQRAQGVLETDKLASDGR